jgi:hypothetical protein
MAFGVPQKKTALQWGAFAVLYLISLAYAISCLSNFIGAMRAPGTSVSVKNTGSSVQAQPFPTITLCNLHYASDTPEPITLRGCLFFKNNQEVPETKIDGTGKNVANLSSCILPAEFTEESKQGCITINKDQKLKASTPGFKNRITLAVAVTSPDLETEESGCSSDGCVDPFQNMGVTVTLSSGLKEFEADVKNTDDLPACDKLTEQEEEDDKLCFENPPLFDKVMLGAQTVASPGAKTTMIRFSKESMKFPISQQETVDQYSASASVVDFTDKYVPTLSTYGRDQYGFPVSKTVFINVIFSTLSVTEVSEVSTYGWQNLFGDVTGVSGFLTGISLWSGPPIVAWRLQQMLL